MRPYQFVKTIEFSIFIIIFFFGGGGWGEGKNFIRRQLVISGTCSPSNIFVRGRLGPVAHQIFSLAGD